MFKDQDKININIRRKKIENNWPHCRVPDGTSVIIEEKLCTLVNWIC